MSSNKSGLLLAGILLMGLRGSVANAQVSQSDLARQILSDDTEELNVALGQLQQLGPQNADRDLRAAMTTALLREADVHAKRDQAARRGEALADLRDPEFVAQLSILVVQLRDPQTIPALSAALFGAPLVGLALANFGEPAAAPVLQVVTGNGWHDAVDGGLIALRFMLEQRDEHALSAATIAGIRRATAAAADGTANALAVRAGE